eukprot:11228359-Lingulodinium_polyedra.AAC.4
MHVPGWGLPGGKSWHLANQRTRPAPFNAQLGASIEIRRIQKRRRARARLILTRPRHANVSDPDYARCLESADRMAALCDV